MSYINRMKEELNELVDKGTKLDKAILTLEGLRDDELGLMYAQLYAMDSYANILEKRIKLAKEINAKIEKGNLI